MNLLLDTQVLVWSILGLPHLSPRARRAISDTDNTVYVSLVSAWEIAIKKSIGKLHLPDDLEGVISRTGFVAAFPTFDDTRILERLPLIHRDPFDRLLVAQAKRGNLGIVTSDRQIARYDVDVIW